jgi:hypothetical protein
MPPRVSTHLFILLGFKSLKGSLELVVAEILSLHKFQNLIDETKVKESVIRSYTAENKMSTHMTGALIASTAFHSFISSGTIAKSD